MMLHTQHVVFGVCKLIDLIVPDIPETVDFQVKRERYLARQALTDADALLAVSVQTLLLLISMLFKRLLNHHYLYYLLTKT